MRLIIVGADGYGKVIAEIAERMGRYSEVNFLDDNATYAVIILILSMIKRSFTLHLELTSLGYSG